MIVLLVDPAPCYVLLLSNHIKSGRGLTESHWNGSGHTHTWASLWWLLFFSRPYAVYLKYHNCTDSNPQNSPDFNRRVSCLTSARIVLCKKQRAHFVAALGTVISAFPGSSLVIDDLLEDWMELYRDILTKFYSPQTNLPLNWKKPENGTYLNRKTPKKNI